MKVKCGTIYNATKIINELAEKPMKVSLLAKMLRLSDDLQKESATIDKQRYMILEKYGDKNEEGNLNIDENGNVSFSSENADKAQEELNELSNTEIEITDRYITEKDLEDSNIELTLNQFNILKNFLEDYE